MSINSNKLPFSNQFERGHSFNWAGPWTSGKYYFNDEYVTDFVVHNRCILACRENHISTDPPEIVITDGAAVDVNSPYWQFVADCVKENAIDVQSVEYDEHTKTLTVNYTDGRASSFELDITVSDESIYVGDEAPENKNKLWIDTYENSEEYIREQQETITSIQNALVLLQRKVNVLMNMRTQGVISGKVTDSTFTEIANSADPEIPEVIADEYEDEGDTQYPEYADTVEPTVNHIAIKIGKYKEIEAAKNYLIDGELVWSTDRSTMYIKVGSLLKKVASNNGSPDDTDDDTMDITELQNYLDKLDHISFVPINDSESTYTVRVNEYGNLIVYNANNDSVLTEPTSRGLYFPGYSEMGGLIINSFYLGGLDKDEHSYQPCSHNFVELANITYSDINLNGLCLMYTYNNSTWFKLPLWGIIKAQSTFLIRGAQCSVLDANTTKLKIEHFDQEWTVDGELIRFDRGNQMAAFYLCWCNLEDDNKIYVMQGDNNAQVNYPSQLSELIVRDDGKVAPGYVDLVGVGGISFYENKAYTMPSGRTIDKDTFFVRTYTLDPVTQSNAKGVAKRNNAKYWRHINLSEIIIDNAAAYTPKASCEKKNLSTDKHNFTIDKPNTLTCSFGIQATDDGVNGATRCFNWNSIGYFDEYLWFKKTNESNWTRVESYKEGIDYSTAYRATDPLCIRTLYEYYTRIRWETFYGAPVTTHKVMIAGLTAGTYEYKVGRSDLEGNPTDYVSDTRRFTVKSNASVTSFDFIQTTDQQGANWEEYEVWSLSADFISRNERIGQTPVVASGQPTPSANSRDFDFIINTGDITYNGSRPNEWVDYYAGYKYLDDKEEMLTLGNNDLAPVAENAASLSDPIGQNYPYAPVQGMTILGYGRERPDKVSHIVADLFYTQEMDPLNPPIFTGEAVNSNTQKTFKVPSLYSFNYGDFHFISLNSEIRTFYGDEESEGSVTTVTGEFGVKDVGSGRTTEIYSKIEDWLVKDLLIWKQGSVPANYTRFSPTNCQKAIIYTHEMPFTITAAATYKSYLDSTSGSVYRETAKANLNRKHDFQFQRLFKLWGIRLVFGGHKHTCSISMPIYDAPTDYNPYSAASVAADQTALMAPLSGADTFNPIIQVVKNDSDPKWGVDAKIGTALGSFNQYRGKIFNSTNTNVTVNLEGGGTQTFNAKSVNDAEVAKPLCRYEIVDAISAPTYVMCQATGFKNMSNSDTSDGEARCQWQRAMVQGSTINASTNKVETLTATDQLYPFYTRFHITSDTIYVNMQRVAGMYSPSSKAGYWNPNRDTPNGHDAAIANLYRYPWASCEISLT